MKTKPVDVERSLREAIDLATAALDSYENKQYAWCLTEIDAAVGALTNCIPVVEKLEDDLLGPKPAA